MLQLQIISQHFYKPLIWPTSYYFSSKPTINITFLFINNHSSHQQFIKKFVKKFISLTLLIKKIQSMIDFFFLMEVDEEF